MHRIRDFYDKYFNNTIINYLLWAFFLNLFIETWARQKMPLYGGLYFISDFLLFSAALNLEEP